MTEREPLLRIEHLNKKYEDGTEHVLTDLDLLVYEEDFLCVLGPSGCGKSTLIRCIAGFEDYEGIIEIEGRTVKKPGPDRTMVFQDFNQLFPWKTVSKNIEYPLKVNGVADKAERRRMAEEYLDKVNLGEYRDYYPHQLSGGMKQRVAIARGMALGSKVMLMDEPFAALDAITRNQMQTELLRIKENAKMTIIFITHNIQEAISMGNRVMVMSKNGDILEDAPNPLEKPVSPATPGYGELWQHLNGLLHSERNDK
ncbi:MAG: ABC transporter ATP-binding protein [Lachnospiraceae bacterium]|nr:ABC transporter ATP-binding protein [Lachnospiraceae bacterium]